MTNEMMKWAKRTKLDIDQCVHKEMAAERWAEMPLAEQMGNIGSEVSRSLKAKKIGNQKRFEGGRFRERWSCLT